MTRAQKKKVSRVRRRRSGKSAKTNQAANQVAKPVEHHYIRWALLISFVVLVIVIVLRRLFEGGGDDTGAGSTNKKTDDSATVPLPLILFMVIAVCLVLIWFLARKLRKLGQESKPDTTTNGKGIVDAVLEALRITKKPPDPPSYTEQVKNYTEHIKNTISKLIPSAAKPEGEERKTGPKRCSIM